MRDGREQLGERWLDVYLTAPVLRFAWAPGVIDARWWFGVLMPSCDSVGRYFPLVIAQPRAARPRTGIALDHLELWYEHLARAALHTLSDDDGGSLDALEAALHEAPPWPTPGRHAGDRARRRARRPSGPRARGDAERVAARPGAARPDAGLPAARVVAPSPKTAAGESVDILQGLPDGGDFAALLRGE